MPRDGSGIYSIPPGTQGVPDTTIESAKYNAFAADLETDLNAPRPIIAGGTGATSATQARDNIDAERAMQTIVSFDADPVEVGSFYAATTATGAPVAGHAFAGIIYGPDADNMVVEARDLSDASTPGILYVREKAAGVWTSWSADADSKVDVAGDTMTGPLILSADPTAPLGAVTKQYADNAIASGTSGLVHYDIAQALTAPQQVQARANIYAAPFDALAFNGMQMNGAMDVSQEYGGAVSPLPSNFVVDGWVVGRAATPCFLSLQQVTDAPPGFRKSIKLGVTVPTSLGGGDINILYHSIEGNRFGRCAFGGANAQPVSFGFLVKVHRPGLYSGSLRNGAADRCYLFPFTVNAADTWEYKTVTIPGDTGGNWPMNSSAGAQLQFCLGCDASRLGVAGAWQAGNLFGVSGSINGCAATTDTFQITGFIMLPGIELPTAARLPFIMRPFDAELALARRYYENTYDYDTPVPSATPTGCINRACYDTSNHVFGFDFKMPKRATPTVTLYAADGSAGTWQAAGSINVGMTVGAASTKGVFYLTGGPTSGLIQGAAYYGHYTADARI